MPNRTCSIDGCTKTAQARTWCPMHYQRWRQTGTTGERPVPPSPEVRFFAKVREAESGCWEWIANRDPRGYGRFNPGNNTPVLCHRWCYEFMVGPIPQGLHLDHLCRNPSCVNPSHLDPVTPAVNMERAKAHHICQPCCPIDARLRGTFRRDWRTARERIAFLESRLRTAGLLTEESAWRLG